MFTDNANEKMNSIVYSPVIHLLLNLNQDFIRYVLETILYFIQFLFIYIQWYIQDSDAQYLDILELTLLFQVLDFSSIIQTKSGWGRKAQDIWI